MKKHLYFVFQFQLENKNIYIYIYININKHIQKLKHSSVVSHTKFTHTNTQVRFSFSASSSFFHTPLFHPIQSNLYIHLYTQQTSHAYTNIIHIYIYIFTLFTQFHQKDSIFNQFNTFNYMYICELIVMLFDFVLIM